MTDQTPNVMDHPIVVCAMNFMTDAHRNHALKPDPILGGQRRKYSGAHYEVHPIQVARMVARSIHNDPVNVACALLHDVEEDTRRGLGHVRQVFGQAFGDEVGADITQGVWELSDVSRPEDGNRAARKALDRDHSWLATPGRQTVKLADMKSNMPSIVAHDPGFARKWVAEKREQWEGLTQGDPQLFEDMRRFFDGYAARQFQPEVEWELV